MRLLALVISALLLVIPAVIMTIQPVSLVYLLSQRKSIQMVSVFSVHKDYVRAVILIIRISVLYVMMVQSWKMAFVNSVRINVLSVVMIQLPKFQNVLNVKNHTS